MTRPDTHRPLPPELTIEPWIDHEVERVGHMPMSTYVESEYLPILGPTATLLFRRIGSWAAMSEEGLLIPTESLAHDLGVSRALTAGAPLPRSVGRLVMFGCAEWRGEALAVRRALPNVPPRWRRAG